MLVESLESLRIYSTSVKTVNAISESKMKLNWKTK